MKQEMKYVLTAAGKPLKILLIYSTSNKNWALHHIAKDLSRVIEFSSVADVPIQRKKIRISNFTRRYRLPYSRVRILMHHKMIGEVRSTQVDHNKINATIFTHDIFDQQFVSKTLPSLKLMDFIFTLSEKDKLRLIDFGIPETNVVSLLGAVDPKFFAPELDKNIREKPRIGLCSNFLNRKNPGQILNMIKENPSVDFILHGKNWNQSQIWEELVNLQNFQYVEFEYANQPEFLNSVDAFVSLSILEGGPTPVLESLMCGIPTIVTPVGYGGEITQHKVNGYVLRDESGSDINAAIQWVLANRKDMPAQFVRGTVIHLNWERYGQILIETLRQKVWKIE